MADRPNILFLMSDEHRPDVTGFEGDRVVRTPTLDWLAEEGVVFRNAYTPSPICIPARQCMMAGQLPRTCGVERYGADLAPFAMTFAHRCAQHGYATTCCGKLHHMGPDQMQGWTARPAGDCSVGPGFIDGRDDAAFEAIASRKPAGVGKWSDVREIVRTGVGEPRHVRQDIRATDAALGCIDEHFIDPLYDRPAAHEPLLLKLSLIQPHYPYFTTQEKLSYYLNRVEPFLDEPVFDHPFLSQRQVRIGEQVTEVEVRRTTAAYYAMVETIDEHYGSVLDRLRFAGQDLDDWIIIYTSDHGEMLGEHGVWEKQKFFEASARVPLIIRLPERLRREWGAAGRVVRENVNLCDLFATLCDLADLPLPADEQTMHGRGLDSRSLVPLMRGDTADWHHLYHDETVSQFGGTNLMIKRGDLKYQFYERADCREQPEVLFDLGRDPAERSNLIDDSRYGEAVEALRTRRGELGFGPDADPDYRNAGYPRH